MPPQLLLLPSGTLPPAQPPPEQHQNSGAARQQLKAPSPGWQHAAGIGRRCVAVTTGGDNAAVPLATPQNSDAVREQPFLKAPNPGWQHAACVGHTSSLRPGGQSVAAWLALAPDMLTCAPAASQ